MSKRFWLIFLIGLGLMAVVVLLPGGMDVAAAQFTVPTRTPTPPPQPTAPPGNGGGPPPAPTSTDEPQATAEPSATPTNVPATLAPTPEGGFLPTAEACSTDPTVQANNKVNVRGGPGTDYDIVGELVYLEVRPISGRAANAVWWQIILADGSLGWVADAVVSVSGYTGQVPLVDVPALPDGTTPTPGPEWDPTPNPACTPPPTFTPTATATGTPTNTPTAAPSNTPTPDTESANAAATTDDATAPATETPIPPTATATEAPTNTPIPTEPVPTAAPLPVDDDNGGSMIWLPIAGIGLMLIGGFLFITRRGG